MLLEHCLVPCFCVLNYLLIINILYCHLQRDDGSVSSDGEYNIQICLKL